MTPLHISQLANTISIPSSTRDHTLSQYHSKIGVKYGSEIIVTERLSIDFTIRVVSSSRLRIQLLSFCEQGGDRACVQDEYDVKLHLAPLTCTSFRSSQAESERFRIL